MKGPPPNPDYIDINDKGRIKISHKIIIPSEYFPGYNFVGKLLGNKGENQEIVYRNQHTHGHFGKR